jgi:urea carboxylase
MIYKETAFRTAGDRYLVVEYGDTAEIELSFRVIALNIAVKKKNIPGIIETMPTARSLGIVFNPFKIKKEELIAKIKEIEGEMKEITELPSRIIKIPVWYNDPWSRECAKAHNVPNNIEYVAEINKMTVEDVIKVHSCCDWWVTAVGFLPGTFGSYPLDSKMTLTAPRYKSPRTWTPDRTLVLGGRSSAMHSVVSPGGFQMLGRTPIDIYDPKQSNPVFRKDPVLVKVGDRLRFLPIGEAEYNEIRRKVEEGTYRYEIEEGVYRLKKRKISFPFLR